MIYMVDIDGTICESRNSDYHNSVPYTDRIEHLNQLFEDGHEIHYWTARGGHSGVDWSDFTVKQLESWGCKYSSIKTKKPVYDLWIDDKSIGAIRYFRGNVK